MEKYQLFYFNNSSLKRGYNMKNTILTALLLAFVAGTTVIAQEPVSSFQYDLNEAGNGIVIKKYVGSNPRLVIPGRIEGYPVVEIGYDGSNIAPQDLLVSVVIPEGVRIIKWIAFANQENLTSVTLPSTLRVIGVSAFSRSGLRTVRIPDSVEEIDAGAFSNCYNLTDVNIPAGIKHIGSYAFGWCRVLSSVTIPASIRSIDWRDRNGNNNTAFNGCALSIATRRRLVELGHPNDF
jgi:hypothetical protein